MEYTKNEPNEIKGYTKNIRTQKPKQALKNKNKNKNKQTFFPLHKHINDGDLECCRNAIVMASMTHHPDPIFCSLC